MLLTIKEIERFLIRPKNSKEKKKKEKKHREIALSFRVRVRRKRIIVGRDLDLWTVGQDYYLLKTLKLVHVEKIQIRFVLLCRVYLSESRFSGLKELAGSLNLVKIL